MARRCTVCTHEDAHAINLALVGGATIRSVAGRYALSRSAVGNHVKNHLPQRIAEGATGAELAREVQQREDQRQAENISLRDTLKRDLAGLDRVHAIALANGNLAAATAAIGTRWTILSRAGLLSDIDAAVTTPSAPDRREEGARVIREISAELMTAFRAIAEKRAAEARTIDVQADDDDEGEDMFGPLPERDDAEPDA